jgi:hypothetical protein
MLTVMVVINALFFYGVATRPYISYHLYTNLDYDETIDFSNNTLMISLRMSNTGHSQAHVWLIVQYYNISLVDSEELSKKEIEGGSQVQIPWVLPPLQQDEDVFNLTFTTTGNATYITLIFSIEGDLEAPITARFHGSFAYFNPERPTAILLKNLGDRRFMRLSGR